MKEVNQADILLKIAQNERLDEIKKQLTSLKTRPFNLIIHHLSLLALAFFFMFYISPSNDDLSFFCMVLFVFAATSAVYYESNRANKRIDLLIKLLKVEGSETK
ncbi:hypothetical protein [Thalassotalea ganghwensis]